MHSSRCPKIAPFLLAGIDYLVENIVAIRLLFISREQKEGSLLNPQQSSSFIASGLRELVVLVAKSDSLTILPFMSMVGEPVILYLSAISKSFWAYTRPRLESLVHAFSLSTSRETDFWQSADLPSLI